MVKIIQKDNKKNGYILRKIAEEVDINDIVKPRIKKILHEMEMALNTQQDGVAIAAPQIGYSLRIFLISDKIFTNKKTQTGKDGNLNDIKKSVKDFMPKPTDGDKLIFINPKIIKLSRDKYWLSEGCLSVRWLYGSVKRSKKAMITAYDENGKKFTRGGSGLLAQIFQHETDHLNGILFVDNAIDLKEGIPGR